MIKNQYRDKVKTLLSVRDFPDDAFYIKERFRGKKIVVYGAGECCHWFVEIVMKIYGCTPQLVLDQRFSLGDHFEGILALSPADYHPSPDDLEDVVAVICVGKQEYHAEIVQRLEEIGFDDIIFLLDIYEIHNPFSLPQALREEGFGLYHRQRQQILQILELLDDEESLKVYCGCLQTHMQRKPVILPARPRQEQYFPEDVRLANGYDRFICCGAYDGDSIRRLHAIYGKVDEIVCFEPEAKIFNRLTDYLRENKSELANRIDAFPCAVYGESKILKFLSGHGLGSRICDAGDSYVQSVTLDDALPGYEPTFICMDVEGVELEALKGAEKILRQCTPDLAICLYHSPEHLWQIPAYIYSLDLGYRFNIRNYTSFTFETVMYASVPDPVH